jgi:drug/metabolite transporter (DMT)-like permease
MHTIGIAYLLSIVFVPPFTLGPALAQDWSHISPLGWATAWYLVIFGTVLAYFTHQYALKRLPAVLIAAASYSQPVLAALFSMLLLGEQLPPTFFISAALIFTGLVLTQFVGRNPAPVTEPAPER